MHLALSNLGPGTSRGVKELRGFTGHKHADELLPNLGSRGDGVFGFPIHEIQGSGI
jgi:hypothetical protein